VSREKRIRDTVISLTRPVQWDAVLRDDIRYIRVYLRDYNPDHSNDSDHSDDPDHWDPECG